MKSITAIEAKKNFEELLNETKTLQQPIQIVGSQTNAVLISEEEWEGIQETLYLLSYPYMGESIQEGLQTPNGQIQTKYKRPSGKCQSKHLRDGRLC